VLEYGIYKTDTGPLPTDPRETCAVRWRAVLPPAPLRAIYFGSEFCIDLLPESKTVGTFCSLARDAEVQAVLLTPLATPGGLEKIKQLLEELTQAGEAPAVVFNDWGVANLLRDSFPHLQRRAGRLMNRGLRDPRLMEKENFSKSLSGDRGRRLRALLASSGVTALETDLDLEGGFFGDGTDGLQRVLYLPYAFAASSRNCLIKADHAQTINECFTKGLDLPCNGVCSRKWHRANRSDSSLPLWRAGNTIFFEVPQFRAEHQIKLADRIVLHGGATD